MAGPDIWGCRKRGVAIFTFAQGIIFTKHPPVHTLEEQNPPSEGLPPSAAWPRSHHQTLGTFWETGSPYSGPDPRALRTPCHGRWPAPVTVLSWLQEGASFPPRTGRLPWAHPKGSQAGRTGQHTAGVWPRCLSRCPLAVGQHGPLTCVWAEGQEPGPPSGGWDVSSSSHFARGVSNLFVWSLRPCYCDGGALPDCRCAATPSQNQGFLPSLGHAPREEPCGGFDLSSVQAARWSTAAPPALGCPGYEWAHRPVSGVSWGLEPHLAQSRSSARVCGCHTCCVRGAMGACLLFVHSIGNCPHN